MELSWFKFSPAQWFMGKIQRCSLETQAEYMRLLCLYWNKEGSLSFEDADEEIENLDELLKKKVVKLDSNNFLIINFLDEQLDNVNEIREKRSKAGKASAKKRASVKQDPTRVEHVLTSVEGCSTEKSRVEKSRVEKSRVEEREKIERKKKVIVFPFDDEGFLSHWEIWKTYKKEEHKFSFRSPTSEQAALKKLSNLATTPQQAIAIINQSIENGWKGFFEIKETQKTNGTRFNESDADKLHQWLNRDRSEH